MRGKVKMFFLVIALLQTISVTATGKSDSLLMLLQTAPEERKPDILYELARFYKYKSVDSSRFYALLAYKSSSQNGKVNQEIKSILLLAELGKLSKNIDSIGYYSKLCIKKSFQYSKEDFLASLYYLWGNYYENKSVYDSAIIYYLKTFNLAKKYHDTVNILNSIIDIGYLKYFWGDTDSALFYLNKALKITEISSYKISIGRVAIMLGNIYFSLENYEKSIDYYKKAYEIAKQANNKSGMGVSLSNIGAAYSDLHNNKMGIKYLTEAIIILKDINDLDVLANTYLSLASNYTDLQQFDKSVLYLNKSLEILKNLDNKEGLTIAYLEYGNTFLKMGEYDKSINYTLKALSIAKEMNFVHMIQRSYERLSLLYSKTGDPQKALSFHIKFDSIKDSISSESLKEQIANFEAKYKSEKQQKEIALLQKDNKIKELEIKKQKWQQNTTFAILVIAVLFAIFLANRYYQNKKITKLLAEKNARISQQNKDLEELTKKQKELIATKDRFFSIIAHDLKSPFGSLQGLTELFYDDFENLSDEEKKEFAKNIKDSAAKLYELLENLLEWSYSQSDKMDIKKEFIDISKITNETIDVLKSWASTKNISIINNIKPGLMVYADKNMVTTIFRNLLSNAIKFSYSGSKITIDYKTLKDKVEISVKDEGVGISKADIDKLFNIGQKVQTKGTANENGTGLGLILCKEFVMKNGGDIYVESKEGEGSKFVFTLPTVDKRKK